MRDLTKIVQMIKQGEVSVVTSDGTPYPQGQALYNGKATNYTRLSPYGLDSNPGKGSFLLLFSSQAQEAVKFGLSAAMTKRFKNLKEGEVALYSPVTKSYYHITLEGIDVLCNGNETINITGNAEVNVDGNVTIVAGGNVALTAVNLTATLSGAMTIVAASNSVLTVTELRINGNLTVNGITNTTSLLIGGVPSPGISKVVGDLQVVAGGGGTGKVIAAADVTAGAISLMTHLHTGVTVGVGNTGGPI